MKKFKTDFKEFYKKIQKSEEKDINCLKIEERKDFSEILELVKLEDLFIWNKQVLKDIQKDVKVEELKKIKRKKTDGWWGKKKGKSHTNEVMNKEEYQEVITEEEKVQMEEFIEKAFTDQESIEEINAKNLIRPDNIPWFMVDFSLECGSVQFTKELMNLDKEIIRFQTAGFHLTFKSFLNGEEILVNLRELEIMMITEYSGSKIPVIVPILYKSSLSIPNDNLFLFLYEKNPYGRPEDVSFTSKVNSIDCVYNPIFIARLTNFFQVQATEENFKNIAWDKIEKWGDSTQKSVQEILATSIKHKIRIFISAPMLIIPFSHNNNDKNCECWIFNLGNLLLKSSENQQPDSFYDLFELKISSIFMKYFPNKLFIDKYNIWKSNKECLKLSDEEKNLFSSVFNVIEDYSVKVQINKIKSQMKSIVDQKIALTKIEGELPELHLNLNQQIFKNLVNLPNNLSLDDENSLDFLQTEKLALMRSEIKSGNLFKQRTTFKKWDNYYAIFSGYYLYFFNKKTDLVPVHHTYIKDSIIQTMDYNSNESGLFSFKVRTIF